MAKPITVVIPCFNQGVYLEDALDSLASCNKDLFDVVIVDDGSSDTDTQIILSELKQKGFWIIEQANQGLGAARNAAIKSTSSKYILPLDADNKILPEYMEKGLDIMEKDDKVAVVYANAHLFGDQQGVLIPGKPNLQKMMLGNYIDACALIRKSVIEEVGFYEQQRMLSYEDWDLWLRIFFAGYRFSYINEVLFEYRVRKDSMVRSVRADMRKQNQAELFIQQKYPEQLDFNYPFDRFIYLIKRHPFSFIYLLILRKIFPATYNKKIQNGKIRAHFIYD